MGDIRLECVAAGRYRLIGQLIFATVPELIASESESGFFADQPEIEVDLSEVERGDSAGLALLVSWGRTARQQGRQLKLVGVSEQLLAMAQVCGLLDVLPLSELPSS